MSERFFEWMTMPVRRYYWHKVVSVLLAGYRTGLINSHQLHELASQFDVTQEQRQCPTN